MLNFLWAYNFRLFLLLPLRSGRHRDASLPFYGSLNFLIQISEIIYPDGGDPIEVEPINVDVY